MSEIRVPRLVRNPKLYIPVRDTAEGSPLELETYIMDWSTTPCGVCGAHDTVGLGPRPWENIAYCAEHNAG